MVETPTAAIDFQALIGRRSLPATNPDDAWQVYRALCWQSESTPIDQGLFFDLYIKAQIAAAK